MTSHHFLLTDSLTSLCGVCEGSASETGALPAWCAGRFCFTLRRLLPPPRRHYAANTSNYEKSRSTRGRVTPSKQSQMGPPQPEALTEQHTPWFAQVQSKGLNYLSLFVSRKSKESNWVKEKNEIKTDTDLTSTQGLLLNVFIFDSTVVNTFIE